MQCYLLWRMKKMLRVLTLEQSREWDEIVKSFKEYDVYYLSGYVKAFQIHGDGEPLLFFYEDNGCRGINVVMKRDISLVKDLTGKIKKGELFDFATPYGYGGWLVEGEHSDRLFASYEKWCFDNNIVSEFVRFHPVLKNHFYSMANYHIDALGETVAIDTTNKEKIWANFNPKNRNVIRKALNNRIEIKHGSSKDLYRTFIKIYTKTMDKDHADDYYYFKEDFFNSVECDLKDNATIFYAELNGLIVAASIIIFTNGRMSYHLSGSLKEYQYLAPSNLLLWKAAEWGHNLGCCTFHLGGGVGSNEDNLFRFKKAFYRGELCRYHIGKKIFNKKLYDELVDLKCNGKSNNFFPEYR